MIAKIRFHTKSYFLRDILEESFSGGFEKHKYLISFSKKPNNEKIKEIIGWYRKQRLVMVLGAGASVSYGLPDWNILLQKLLLLTIKPDSDEGGSELEKAGILAQAFTNIFEPNSLISARYLNNYFKKNKPGARLAFEKAIRDALYVGIESSKDSDLLKEVRKFCIAAGKSPNLDSIITYNYDDLLEQCLRNIDVDIPFIPIHARGMKHEQHQLPIYHVHGYLPQKGQLTEKNKVVLSEDGYHQQYSDVYGWSNLIQINKFKDHNCIFIGLSFTDPNLRRLLDVAKKERGDDDIHHYCFKKSHDKQSVKNKLEKLLAEDNKNPKENVNNKLEPDEISEDLIKLMEKFEENDALSFGVGIIWVNSYDEIPGILKQVRTAV